VSSNLVDGEVYWIQHYVIKFVSDLRQVGGFLRIPRFPPPIKLTAIREIKVVGVNGRGERWYMLSSTLIEQKAISFCARFK
jgi:hypothetical protein